MLTLKISSLEELREEEYSSVTEEFGSVLWNYINRFVNLNFSSTSPWLEPENSLSTVPKMPEKQNSSKKWNNFQSRERTPLVVITYERQKQLKYYPEASTGMWLENPISKTIMRN